MAVLVLTPWGGPHRTAPSACAAFCVPCAQSIVLGFGIDLDTVAPLPAVAPLTGSTLRQPLPAGNFAASATLQDVLIASRMGGRLGP